MSELSKARGKSLVIRGCIVGENLNLVQLRGFASLDQLADMSGPDVFDQVSNPFGTQRDLLPKHAKEASNYAIESTDADAESDPRAFTEVILNVRDETVLSIVSDGTSIDFSSLSGNEHKGKIVDIEIDLRTLTFPPAEHDPQISRLDGNHRLSRVPALGEREDQDFPTIPFAMFVGLGKDQERKLFADINGTQVKMNTSHLSQIKMQLDGDRLLLDAKTRPLWFAKKMAFPPGVFSDVIYQGGSKSGVRKEKGFVPPVTLAQLKSMVGETLKKLDSEFNQVVSAELLEKAVLGDKEAMQQIVVSAGGFLKLQTYFWEAVKTVYAEAWQDHKKRAFVLFQSVGIVALSRFAGDLISDLMPQERVRPNDFKHEIQELRNAGLTLDKGEYVGLAGLAGANKIYNDIHQKYADGNQGFLKIQHLLQDEVKSELGDE